MMRRTSRMLGMRGLLTAAVMLLAVSGVSAQTITDAGRAEFSPSPDSSLLDPSGHPLVTNYILYIYPAGGTSPLQSANLGKPAPDPDGLIRVDFLSLLTTPLAAGVVYEARVGANGSQGLSLGNVSNTFSYSAPCASPTVSPLNQAEPAAGGTASATVTIGAGCAWTATSGAAWITVTSGASGAGSGTVTFTVAANATSAPRTGTLTIAGATVTVTQAGVGCSYTISPVSQTVASGGGSGAIAVTAPAGCAWTSTSGNTWISVTAGASGSGNGTVTFSVAGNTTTSSRTGTITVSGYTFTITQGGASCAYTISPTSQGFVAGGGSATIMVSAPSGCAWTATTANTWISVTDGASGSGNGTVTFGVASNPTTSPRTGTISVGGNTFTVTQGGTSACTYTISPTSQSVGFAGISANVAVTAGAACAWTATSGVPWASIIGGTSGSGNATVTFSVTQNPTTATRSGTLTIAGRSFTILQAASPCSYTVTPTTVTVPAGGGTGTISVTTTAGCTWSGASATSWIAASGSGSGSGSLPYAVGVNTTTSSRTGSIIVAGRVVSITQAAPAARPKAPTGVRIVR